MVIVVVVISCLCLLGLGGVLIGWFDGCHQPPARRQLTRSEEAVAHDMARRAEHVRHQSATNATAEQLWAMGNSRPNGRS